MSHYRPSGWDNEKKIAILYENIQSFSPDDNYSDIIRAHHSQNVCVKWCCKSLTACPLAHAKGTGDCGRR